MIDDRLERLSNLTRRGIPIDFHEVMEVCEYQSRKKSLLDKIVGWWYYKKGLTPQPKEVKSDST